MKKQFKIGGSTIVVVLLVAIFINYGSFLNPLSPRPFFGFQQVKSIDEIHEGDYLLDVHRGYSPKWKVVQVVKEPYWNTETSEDGSTRGSWKIDLLYLDSHGEPIIQNGHPHIESVFLTDNGVVPYASGWWNDVNALIKIKKSDISPDKLGKIVRGIIY